MGILADLLTGAVTRPGIKVIDNKSVTFEGFDAMCQNPDVVSEIVPKLSNFDNWGIDKDGNPVCIDEVI